MKIRRWLIPVCIVGSLVTLSSVAVLRINSPMTGGVDRKVIVQVYRGDTVRGIARKLKGYGLIRSNRFLVLYLRLKGEDQEIKAGEYELSSSMRTTQMARALVTGSVVMVTFTIPEGLRMGQIADILSERGIATREGFLEACRDPDTLAKYSIPFDTAEGFLFPDTYKIAQGLGAAQIVDIMIARFFEQLDTLTPPVEGEDLAKLVIIASLVEREAQVDEERPLVAAVFYNRLARHKRLESCATIQYILGKPRERLLLSDLRIPSPYNTYLNSGLPPGPIASPGIKSLDAALNPADVDYLFFVSKRDGTHYFSSTYDEHLRAIERYSSPQSIGHHVS
jgi:UPF0755 protein